MRSIGESEAGVDLENAIVDLEGRVDHLGSEVAYCREQIGIIHGMIVQLELGQEIAKSAREIERELGVTGRQKAAQVSQENAGRLQRKGRKIMSAIGSRNASSGKPKPCKQPMRMVLTPKPKVETCAGDSQKKKGEAKRRKGSKK